MAGVYRSGVRRMVREVARPTAHSGQIGHLGRNSDQPPLEQVHVTTQRPAEVLRSAVSVW